MMVSPIMIRRCKRRNGPARGQHEKLAVLKESKQSSLDVLPSTAPVTVKHTRLLLFRARKLRWIPLLELPHSCINASKKYTRIRSSSWDEKRSIPRRIPRVECPSNKGLRGTNNQVVGLRWVSSRLILVRSRLRHNCFRTSKNALIVSNKDIILRESFLAVCFSPV